MILIGNRNTSNAKPPLSSIATYITEKSDKFQSSVKNSKEFKSKMTQILIPTKPVSIYKAAEEEQNLEELKFTNKMSKYVSHLF